MANEVKKADPMYKPGKYILRVLAAHPTGKFNLQGHVIKKQYQVFQLNEKECEELASEGPSKWVQIGNDAALKADQKLWAEIERK